MNQGEGCRRERELAMGSHGDLVRLGSRWVKRQGFPVIATEIAAVGSREQPDIIGFRSTASVVVEVKVSRADFLADARKPERAPGGMGLGLYRFYLCPEGVLQAEDMPPRWGLRHARGRSIVEIKRPTGNTWPPAGKTYGDWEAFQHQACQAKERAVLFSIARRLASGR